MTFREPRYFVKMDKIKWTYKCLYNISLDTPNNFKIVILHKNTPTGKEINWKWQRSMEDGRCWERNVIQFIWSWAFGNLNYIQVWPLKPQSMMVWFLQLLNINVSERDKKNHTRTAVCLSFILFLLIGPTMLLCLESLLTALLLSFSVYSCRSNIIYIHIIYIP